jgi:rhomboid protease GluP
MRLGLPDGSAMILTIIVLACAAIYFMTPQERGRLGRMLLGHFNRAKQSAADRFNARHNPNIEHQPTPLVTICLVAINLTAFVWMVASGLELGNEQTLIAWGGNFGPATTNGEWWRMLTAMFVHNGVLALIINCACLLQIGTIIERNVGRAAFGAVYIATGVLASAVNLAMNPVTVNVGAAGAILGLHGFLIACVVWSHFPGSPVEIPLAVLKRLAPVTAAFVIYHTVTSGLGDAMVLAGFGGMGCGVLLCRKISEGQPGGFRIAVVAGITMMFALDAVIPLRGMANVRPELDRLVTLEERTGGDYKIAVEEFTKGRATSKALADFIQGSIIPQVSAARARVDALDKVPESQQPLVASARVYLRLRDESWRLRAEALRKASMAMLRQADGVEHASLIALQQVTIAK